MIENNKFFFNNLKTIVFLGYSEKMQKLIDINNKFKLKTLVVTSSHQLRNMDKKIKVNIINTLNNNFKRLINKKCVVENTLFISMGARYIFKKDIIVNLLKQNIVNFHHSRLPYDSGGGGYSWRILREDRIDNQLVHLINEKIDSGPIIESSASIFPKNCKIPIDFENYKLTNFVKFYEKFIKKIKSRTKFELKHQVNYLGRYNPRLDSTKDNLIDWNLNSYELFNFINAFDEPYPGAATYINNGKFGKLFLKNVHLHGGDFSNHPYQSGIVSRHDKNWIVVNTTGKHVLLVEKILNKKKQNIISKIKAGDRFFTPYKKIAKAKSQRTVYDSKGLKNKITTP